MNSSQPKSKQLAEEIKQANTQKNFWKEEKSIAEQQVSKIRQEASHA